MNGLGEDTEDVWWRIIYELRLELDPTDAEVVSQPFDLRCTKRWAREQIWQLRYEKGGS